MGFLIFAFRKLTLKRSINQKEYRLMSLSHQQQQIHQQMSLMEQAKAQMQDAWSMVSNNLSGISGNIFQVQQSCSTAAASKAANEYSEALKSGNQQLIKDAEAKMYAAKESAETQQKVALGVYQASQAVNIGANYAINSVFSASDKAALAMLHMQDQRYDQEKASLESQLKKENAELEGVEKAEGDAAKKAAPTFGLS